MTDQRDSGGRRPAWRRAWTAWLAFCCACTLVLLAQPAQATSCMMPTPQFADRFSDVVFEAVAQHEVSGEPSMTTRLQVSKVYRGDVPARIDATHGGMKGYTSFEMGKRYLVFGVLSGDAKDKLFIHLCGATHELPATGRFAENGWRGWSVAKAFGPARKPSGALRGGERGSDASAAASAQTTATAAPSAPPPSPPPPGAPDAAPQTEPQPPAASATPVPLAPPRTVPVAKPKSGCGGCALVVGQRPDGGAWLLLVGLAAVWSARRRRS